MYSEERRTSHAPRIPCQFLHSDSNKWRHSVKNSSEESSKGEENWDYEKVDEQQQIGLSEVNWRNIKSMDKVLRKTKDI